MPNIFEHVIKFFTPKKKASILNTFLFLERGKLADKELVSLALKVPYVVSAVELISNAVANLPFKYNNSRAEELLMSPNPEQSQMEFFKELTTDLLLFGNAYVYLNTVRHKRTLAFRTVCNYSSRQWAGNYKIRNAYWKQFAGIYSRTNMSY